MNPIAHFDLHPHNTFGLRAHAAWGLPFTDLETLQQTLQDPRWNSLPRLVVGGGSNVLFTCDFAGLVLINQLKGIRLHEADDHWSLHVAAVGSDPQRAGIQRF